jgi:hypothetical protein
VSERFLNSHIFPLLGGGQGEEGIKIFISKGVLS